MRDVILGTPILYRPELLAELRALVAGIHVAYPVLAGILLLPPVWDVEPLSAEPDPMAEPGLLEALAVFGRVVKRGMAAAPSESFASSSVTVVLPKDWLFLVADRAEETPLEARPAFAAPPSGHDLCGAADAVDRLLTPALSARP